MLEINMLKAKNGDSFLIKIYDKHTKCKNILVDTGPRSCAGLLDTKIKEIYDKKEKLDLVIITHSDGDHIGGLVKLIEEEFDYSIIKELWINDGGEIKINDNSLYTALDGRNVVNKLIKNNVNVKTRIITDFNICIGSANITVLTPTNEDLGIMSKKWKQDEVASLYSAKSDDACNIHDLMGLDDFINDSNSYNNASISFMLEENNNKILFLGDTSSNSVIKGLTESKKIKECEIDIMKLPHHGSKKNTSDKLLENFKTNKYLLSTNGSNSKPNKATIARILKSNENDEVYLYSNYNWWNGDKFTEEDYTKYINTDILKLIELNDSVELKKGVIIKSGN